MPCKVEGCDGFPFKKGCCSMHYTRFRTHGTYDDPNPPVKCNAEGCERMVTGKTGLCIPHYKQWWYLENVAKRDYYLERASKGQWKNVASGYVMVKHNGKLDYEHRVLAEKALGRKLPEGAIVHHMIAPDDNHGFCKLVICPDQAYHFLLHKRMKELGCEVD